MLRDISRGKKDVAEVLRQIAELDADIIALQSIDYDADALTLSALKEATGYAYAFAGAPNTGLRSAADLNTDGMAGGRGDTQSFGWFSGQAGMALLSRYPIDQTETRDFSDLIWADLTWATLPQGGPGATEDARAEQRLSYVGHWRVVVETPLGPLVLLMAHASPPVFDGPEDRNGYRNADEIRLLERLAERALANDPSHLIVILGVLNLDPNRGDGQRDAIAELLSAPFLTDPLPRTPTADFGVNSVGKLRVSYVLPSRALKVLDAGRLGEFDERNQHSSRHLPIWVDLTLPDPGG